jgi:beta-fructofuranosidase
MTAFSVERANQFIEEKEKTVDKTFYPAYHFAAPVGWINDPNGFSYYQDQYHLFYQYNPYDSVWGPMHWGHAVSPDGVDWKHLPVALAPDEPYDKGGCFSGSAIAHEGKLYLMYTGHLPGEEEGETLRQNQNIAYSEDGIHFEKYAKNPVLDEKDVPEGASVEDFRDPKVFKQGNHFYAVIGSRTIDSKGQVLLYRSENLLDWEFVSVVFQHNPYLGTMVECPDFMEVDGKAVFMLSAMNYTDKETNTYYPHITWFIEGEMDWDTHTFKMTRIKELDKGMDFYAPQSFSREGETTFIAWMQGWHNTIASDTLQHGWAGQMTLPRTLFYEDGILKQAVVPTFEKALDTIREDKEITVEGELLLADKAPKYLSMRIPVSELGERLQLCFGNATGEHILVDIDRENQELWLDRSHTAYPVKDRDGKSFDKTRSILFDAKKELFLQIYNDRSSIEIVMNDEESLTMTYYTAEPLQSWSIISNGQSIIHDVKIAD